MAKLFSVACRFPDPRSTRGQGRRARPPGTRSHAAWAPNDERLETPRPSGAGRLLAGQCTASRAQRRFLPPHRLRSLRPRPRPPAPPTTFRSRRTTCRPTRDALRGGRRGVPRPRDVLHRPGNLPLPRRRPWRPLRGDPVAGPEGAPGVLRRSLREGSRSRRQRLRPVDDRRVPRELQPASCRAPRCLASGLGFSSRPHASRTTAVTMAPATGDFRACKPPSRRRKGVTRSASRSSWSRTTARSRARTSRCIARRRRFFRHWLDECGQLWPSCVKWCASAATIPMASPRGSRCSARSSMRRRRSGDRGRSHCGGSSGDRLHVAAATSRAATGTDSSPRDSRRVATDSHLSPARANHPRLGSRYAATGANRASGRSTRAPREANHGARRSSSERGESIQPRREVILPAHEAPRSRDNRPGSACDAVDVARGALSIERNSSGDGTRCIRAGARSDLAAPEHESVATRFAPGGS